jgi:hypothetical protein
MRDPSGYNQLIKGVRGNVAGTLAGSGSSKVPTLHSQEESLATLSTMSAMLEAFIPKKKKKNPQMYAPWNSSQLAGQRRCGGTRQRTNVQLDSL